MRYSSVLLIATFAVTNVFSYVIPNSAAGTSTEAKRDISDAAPNTDTVPNTDAVSNTGGSSTIRQRAKPEEKANNNLGTSGDRAKKDNLKGNKKPKKVDPANNKDDPTFPAPTKLSSNKPTMKKRKPAKQDNAKDGSNGSTKQEKAKNFVKRSPEKGLVPAKKPVTNKRNPGPDSKGDAGKTKTAPPVTPVKPAAVPPPAGVPPPAPVAAPVAPQPVNPGKEGEEEEEEEEE